MSRQELEIDYIYSYTITGFHNHIDRVIRQEIPGLLSCTNSRNIRFIEVGVGRVFRLSGFREEG